MIKINEQYNLDIINNYNSLVDNTHHLPEEAGKRIRSLYPLTLDITNSANISELETETTKIQKKYLPKTA